MEINKDSILLISNHHRRSPFFESSMRRLWDDGFQNVIIQNTGGGEFCNYAGPAREIFNSSQIPYDSGMVNFKARLANESCDAIALMDNDCFLGGTEHFKRYVEDFISGGFDFACHFIQAGMYAGLTEKHGCIYKVPQVKMLSSDVFPFIVPEPHFENAYLLISKQMWDRLSSDDVSHGRKFIAALVREKAKFGAHEAKYVGSHSHYGDEWFHVGNLMSYYHHVESGSIDCVSSGSQLDKSRLGYFAVMEDSYGEIYPASYKASLDRFYQRLGGRDQCRSAWNELTKDTCMMDWKI